jgi:hypothetical protein
MLKFKKIELLTKTDKNPSVNQNTDVVTRRLQDIWLIVLRRGIIFFLGGRWLFAVEESSDEEKEGEIGEDRGYINFYRWLHRRTIPSVILSATLSANRARHRTVLPFWICRHSHRWIGHITVRSWSFESFGDSVGIYIGESVTSPYKADVLNPSMIPSVKNTHNNLHVSEPPSFFKFSTFRP